MRSIHHAGLTLLVAAALPTMAAAAELRQIGTIDVPGAKLANFDISASDPETGRYYLSDRSNKAIDIFDTNNDTYVGRVGSFVGAVMKDGKVASDVSGPGRRCGRRVRGLGGRRRQHRQGDRPRHRQDPGHAALGGADARRRDGL